MTKKNEIFSLVGPVLSIFAVLGPFSYALLAIHEIGRLKYLNAPVRFLQISSFGIDDVVTTVYPTILPVVCTLLIFLRVVWLRGQERVRALLFGMWGLCLILFFVASNLYVKLGLAIGFLGLMLVLIYRQQPHVIELGNQVEREATVGETWDQAYLRRGRLAFWAAVVMFVVGWIVYSYGEKAAASDEFYWCSKDEVIIGFYGGNVLVSKLADGVVGPGFSIKEVKELRDISLQRVGPLKTAPLWKPPKRNLNPLENLRSH